LICPLKSRFQRPREALRPQHGQPRTPAPAASEPRKLLLHFVQQAGGYSVDFHDHYVGRSRNQTGFDQPRTTSMDSPTLASCGRVADSVATSMRGALVHQPRTYRYAQSDLLPLPAFHQAMGGELKTLVCLHPSLADLVVQGLYFEGDKLQTDRLEDWYRFWPPLRRVL
jgi:hypothetical protein